MRYINICTHIGTLFNLTKGGNSGIVTTWMHLENIMLSEISQARKDRYRMILLIRIFRKGKFVEAK